MNNLLYQLIKLKSYCCPSKSILSTISFFPGGGYGVNFFSLKHILINFLPASNFFKVILIRISEYFLEKIEN